MVHFGCHQAVSTCVINSKMMRNNGKDIDCHVTYEVNASIASRWLVSTHTLTNDELIGAPKRYTQNISTMANP
jgi:hypothetical protein